MKKSLVFFLLQFSFSALAQNTGIQYHSLSDSHYVFTTTHNSSSTSLKTNGMYLVTDEGILVINSPGNSTEFESFYSYITQKHQRPITHFIATTSYTEGTHIVDFFKSKGVKTYSTRETDHISKASGEKRTEFYIDKEATFKFGHEVIKLYYPGPGSSTSNIVVWFSKQEILYAGCFLQGSETRQLMHITSSNAPTWRTAVLALRNHFPPPKHIVCAHGNYLASNAFNHTLRLLQQHQ